MVDNRASRSYATVIAGATITDPRKDHADMQPLTVGSTPRHERSVST